MGSRMLWKCELDSLEAGWQQQRSKYGNGSPTDTVILYKCLVNRNLYLITFTLSFTLIHTSIPQVQTFHSLVVEVYFTNIHYIWFNYLFIVFMHQKMYNS